MVREKPERGGMSVDVRPGLLPGYMSGFHVRAMYGSRRQKS